MIFSRREDSYQKPKPWAVEIALRQNELQDEIALLRSLALIEKDPVLLVLQCELIAELKQQMVIPGDELGMNLERLAR